jgi:IS30 family transposase
MIFTTTSLKNTVRQYFPKGTDFSTVTAQRIQEVENMLNNRPRKRLGYRTPNQVWREAMNSDNYRVALNA